MGFNEAGTRGVHGLYLTAQDENKGLWIEVFVKAVGYLAVLGRRSEVERVRLEMSTAGPGPDNTVRNVCRLGHESAADMGGHFNSL